MSHNVVNAPPGEAYFTIVRSFDAPRRLVYKCYTEPQHMVHFWGPRNSTLEVCTIDLRVGGLWAIRWRFPSGDSWGYSSVYLDIVANERLHYRDAPDGWAGGLDGLPPVDLLSTIALSEQDGRTEVTVRVECVSVTARDEAIKRGFSGMVSVGHDRLDDYLRTLDQEA